jgi:hypothetical protein
MFAPAVSVPKSERRSSPAWRVGRPGELAREVDPDRPGPVAARGLLDPRPSRLDEVHRREPAAELDVELLLLLGGVVVGGRHRLAGHPGGDIEEGHRERQARATLRRALGLLRDHVELLAGRQPLT